MKKILILFLFFQTSVLVQDLEKAYFAGGCFWCMEESFEKKEGVYRSNFWLFRRNNKNPTYKKLHMEQQDILKQLRLSLIKIKQIIKILLDHFWKNIDPFDANGQFCDKGYSYRSVAFYKNDEQIDLIEKNIKIREKI